MDSDDDIFITQSNTMDLIDNDALDLVLACDFPMDIFDILDNSTTIDSNAAGTLITKLDDEGLTVAELHDNLSKPSDEPTKSAPSRFNHADTDDDMAKMVTKR